MTEGSLRDVDKQALQEEYRQRNEFLRYWATEQRLVALAILSFNGATLVNWDKLKESLSSVVLSFVMVLLGVFGVMHNNRLCKRYDQNEKRLTKLAKDLHINTVFHEDDYEWRDHNWYKPTTMRFWFYLLYIGTIAFWMFWIGQATGLCKFAA